MKNKKYISENLIIPYGISSGKIDYAKFSFSVNGLASDTVGNIVLDGKYELKQPHPCSNIYICPIHPNSHPSINELWFYNNCLSYLNEIAYSGETCHPFRSKVYHFPSLLIA